MDKVKAYSIYSYYHYSEFHPYDSGNSGFNFTKYRGRGNWSLNLDNYSPAGLIITAVIIAPILETLLTQLLPIKFIKSLLKYRAELIAISISAVIFSLMHFGYSIWYSLLTLPLGILLAKTYLIFQNRRESGFWVTTGVHAFRNLIGVMSILATDKI